MNKIYIVGMGPGFESMMTKQAIDALEASDVIVGYTVYIKLLGENSRQRAFDHSNASGKTKMPSVL